LASNPCQACFPVALPVIEPAFRHTATEQASGSASGHRLPLLNYRGFSADGLGGGGLGQQSRQGALPLEQDVQHAQDGKGPGIGSPVQFLGVITIIQQMQTA